MRFRRESADMRNEDGIRFLNYKQSKAEADAERVMIRLEYEEETERFWLQTLKEIEEKSCPSNPPGRKK